MEEEPSIVEETSTEEASPELAPEMEEMPEIDETASAVAVASFEEAPTEDVASIEEASVMEIVLVEMTPEM